MFVMSFHAIDEENYIIIDKQKLFMYVVNSNTSDTVFSSPIGLGKELGNKEHAGDNRTPEGTFFIESIEKSTHWVHDFHDGFGPREGAYGDWFIRLRTPKYKGIGIHGTCFPESIGTRCSEGCIRLNNEQLLELRKLCYVGMKVIITKD
ncbi:MAG: L,D-transpeptidase [Bacteroidales bacterium]|nr:L,D-transpeptidase [Bacteroidales bacterium]